MSPKASLLALALLLAGCGAAHPEGDPGLDRTLLADLKDGWANLDCTLACAGRWGAQRPHLLALLNQGRWEALGLAVLRTGFNDTLAWYYLGRAAEGLGWKEAAMLYYLATLAAPPCDAYFNNCDGFVLPRDAKLRAGVLGLPLP